MNFIEGGSKKKSVLLYLAYTIDANNEARRQDRQRKWKVPDRGAYADKRTGPMVRRVFSAMITRMDKISAS